MMRLGCVVIKNNVFLVFNENYCFKSSDPNNLEFIKKDRPEFMFLTFFGTKITRLIQFKFSKNLYC